MQFNKTIIAITALCLSGAAFAGAKCPKAPKDQWMSETAMKQKLADEGYTVKKFKADGDCYELYGKDKDGKKVEIYFNPVDGSVVKDSRTK